MSVFDTIPPSGGSWVRNPATGELTPLAQPGAQIDAEAVLAEVMTPETDPAPQGAPAEQE